MCTAETLAQDKDAVQMGPPCSSRHVHDRTEPEHMFTSQSACLQRTAGQSEGPWRCAIARMPDTGGALIL